MNFLYQYLKTYEVRYEQVKVDDSVICIKYLLILNLQIRFLTLLVLSGGKGLRCAVRFSYVFSFYQLWLKWRYQTTNSSLNPCSKLFHSQTCWILVVDSMFCASMQFFPRLLRFVFIVKIFHQRVEKNEVSKGSQ